jgi:hypothetical protein
MCAEAGASARQRTSKFVRPSLNALQFAPPSARSPRYTQVRKPEFVWDTGGANARLEGEAGFRVGMMMQRLRQQLGEAAAMFRECAKRIQ